MTDHDVGDVAALLGVTERTVRRWLREGRLTGYKVGGRIRIPERAVREAAVPYGSRRAAPATASDDPVVAFLAEPARAAAARRLARAAAEMDELRARSTPPSGPDETAEALVRAVRDGHPDERANG